MKNELLQITTKDCINFKNVQKFSFKEESRNFIRI